MLFLETGFLLFIVIKVSRKRWYFDFSINIGIAKNLITYQIVLDLQNSNQSIGICRKRNQTIWRKRKKRFTEMVGKKTKELNHTL